MSPGVEGASLVLLIVVMLMPGTELAMGVGQMSAATSNRINKSPGDKIKHLDYI